MKTFKKYCEENNLDTNNVFNAIFGVSGSFFPSSRNFSSFIAEIKDDCLEFTSDYFGVYHKQIPFSAFQKAEFGIGSGQLWLQCIVDGEEFIFCMPRRQWKAPVGKLLMEKISPYAEILDMDAYKKATGKLAWLYLIMYAW